MSPIYDMPPTRRERQHLAATLLHGTKGAAALLGVSEKTVKNMLTTLYCRIGAYGRVDAANRLGWLNIPDDLGIPSPDESLGPVLTPADHLADAVVAYAQAVWAQTADQMSPLGLAQREAGWQEPGEGRLLGAVLPRAHVIAILEDQDGPLITIGGTP